MLLHGGSATIRYNFDGIIERLDQKYAETQNEDFKEELESFMRTITCEVCQGQRLKPESLSVYVGGKHISDITALSVRDARLWFEKLSLTGKDKVIAEKLLKEILKNFR